MLSHSTIFVSRVFLRFLDSVASIHIFPGKELKYLECAMDIAFLGYTEQSLAGKKLHGKVSGREKLHCTVWRREQATL